MSDNTNTKVDWSKVPLSDEFTWTDGTSSNGHQYKIGIPKTTNEDPSPAHKEGETVLYKSVSNSSKVPFDINVKWYGRPLSGGFGGFSTPSAEETATTSITSYKLNTGALWYNEFCFTCTKSYKFCFYDKTGDCYGNNVFWPRDGTVHSVMFFSSDPTIVRVKGS